MILPYPNGTPAHPSHTFHRSCRFAGPTGRPGTTRIGLLALTAALGGEELPQGV